MSETSKTPRTDREVYTVSAADVGFEVVNPALCREFEQRLSEIQRELDNANAAHKAEQEMREKYAQYAVGLNRITMELTAALAQLPALYQRETDPEHLSREEVMKLVTSWRMKWDALNDQAGSAKAGATGRRRGRPRTPRKAPTRP